MSQGIKIKKYPATKSRARPKITENFMKEHDTRHSASAITLPAACRANSVMKAQHQYVRLMRKSEKSWSTALVTNSC